MNRLQRHASTLHLLKKGNPGLQRAILGKCSNDLVKVICECALNVLHGTAPISNHHKNKLRKHKTKLRELANRKVSLKKKRKIIQSGGFLGALLGAIVPAITGLLSGLSKG